MICICNFDIAGKTKTNTGNQMKSQYWNITGISRKVVQMKDMAPVNAVTMDILISNNHVWYRKKYLNKSVLFVVYVASVQIDLKTQKWKMYHINSCGTNKCESTVTTMFFSYPFWLMNSVNVTSMAVLTFKIYIMWSYYVESCSALTLCTWIAR